jgi:hypothetical protein
MIADAYHASDEVVEEMRDWLGISERTYVPAVRLFALRLPAHKLIEALWVAQSRKPYGGLEAFRYFCGVCHSMHRELSGEYSKN